MLKSFLIKACNFIKKRLQHSCFSVTIAKFLRTALFVEYIRWLLLNAGKTLVESKSLSLKKLLCMCA